MSKVQDGTESMCTDRVHHYIKWSISFIILANQVIQTIISIASGALMPGTTRFNVIIIYLPVMFVLLDFIVVASALVRVRRILERDYNVKRDTKFMAIHVVMLFLLVGSNIFFNVYVNILEYSCSLWVMTIYNIVDFSVSLLIAFILWEVSRKKYFKP